METPATSPDFSSPEWAKLFEALLSELERRKCVLLLGPEITRADGKTIREVLRQHLAKLHPDDIAHFHERDGLYLFSDAKGAKQEVQSSVSLFYEKAKPESSVFEKIARLPFALTISITPDHFLLDSFPKTSKPTFAFFKHSGVSDQTVLDAWDRKTPLIYNLCGSFLEEVSMVLDYNDLFNLLKSVMGAGLHKNIRLTLDDARSFLFIGFDFDKWYTQLLLRLLCGDNTPKHIALNTQFGDKDNHTFLLKQFNIKFIGEDEDFLDELCRRWQAQSGEAGAPGAPGKAAVLSLIEKNKLPDALAMLELLVTSADDRALLTMARNWHSQWEQETLLGKTDDRTLFNLKNQVVFTAQTLANKLPDTP